MLLCVVMSMKFLSGVGVIQKHYSLPCITTTPKRGGEAVIYSLLRPSFFPLFICLQLFPSLFPLSV